MGRFAYLIIAHKSDATFNSLLTMLDNENNDIFIHMDQKNKNFSEEDIKAKFSKSTVYCISRRNVTWGDFSIVQVELDLIRAACSNGREYQYLHLISGQDLPIQSNEYIHSFFDSHVGREFVRFEKPSFDYDDRIKYYHILQPLVGRSKNIFLRGLNMAILLLQKGLRVNRNSLINFQKGTQWFSITSDFARYILSKEEWITKVFRNTLCADEIFVQTVLLNSDFLGNAYHCDFNNNEQSIMRRIDWNRGRPYTFRFNDLDELKRSNLLFARKFDSSIDEDIITSIVGLYSK